MDISEDLGSTSTRNKSFVEILKYIGNVRKEIAASIDR